MRRRILLSIITVLILAAGIVFWQRTQIVCWYCVHRLATANDDNRALWAERVAGLDEAVVPRLLDCLYDEDAKTCANAEVALALVARKWAAEARSENVLEELRLRLSHFSPAGRHAALRFPIELLRTENAALSATFTLSAGQLLAGVAHDTSVDPSNALKLAGQLSERVPPGQWHDICRDIALRGLKDTRPANRVLAIHLSLNAVFSADEELLSSIAPLLHDADGRVRRAALVAVGASKILADEDDLLPLLHDGDHEIRRLCEVALRSRGLGDDDLQLARLVSDARASSRLEVFNHLYGADRLEPGVWLRRLSQDQSPAVRAAAIRSAFLQRRVELRDRIGQMAREDPSITVRQLAQHYLTRLESKD